MMKSLIGSASPTPPWFVSNFDSATGLVKALSSCLHGKGFPGAGSLKESELLADVINLFPWSIQKKVYVMRSAKGAVDPQDLHKINGEEFCEWVVSLYPDRKYPALFIGSSSGPAVHMAAAMGVPWLPQTFLIPVKTPDLSADAPIQRMEWAKPWARQLLDNNPDLQLHHMMDPLQDRPMLPHASYFRVKKLTLGMAYEDFIHKHLESGGKIYLIECQKTWLATRIDDRHYFQFGGLGGLTEKEYYEGGDRVKKFLEDQGAAIGQWDAPSPDGQQPESEWGFVPSLREDVIRITSQEGYDLKRILYNEPEDLSAYVADLYRWWYRQRGIPEHRLLAEMFFLVEPYWALRAGVVPFWLAFNSQGSTDRLKKYLQQTDPYDEVYILPFSNGVSGPGVASEEELKSVLAMAKEKGVAPGTTPGKYPYDFGLFARYEKALKEAVPARYPMDQLLSPDQLTSFRQEAKKEYPVSWM